MNYLEGYSLRLIALTRGREGSILYSVGIIYMHDGYRVEAKASGVPEISNIPARIPSVPPIHSQ
jgi:hypothetical protein